MTILALLLASVLAVVPAADEPDDVKAIKQTIAESYVEGIHVQWNEEAMRAGFNDAFIMFILRGDEVSHLSKADWISRMKPSDKKNDVDYKIPMVDVQDTAATARIEIYRDGKHVFTDYMLLYKVGGKWQITGKVYHRHQ